MPEIFCGAPQDSRGAWIARHCCRALKFSSFSKRSFTKFEQKKLIFEVEMKFKVLNNEIECVSENN